MLTDALKEIEDRYGNVIDDTLSLRDYLMPILAIGLPSSSAFGNIYQYFYNDRFKKSIEENCKMNK